jgi:hypothetical protein
MARLFNLRLANIVMKQQIFKVEKMDGVQVVVERYPDDKCRTGSRIDRFV